MPLPAEPGLVDAWFRPLRARGYSILKPTGETVSFAYEPSFSGLAQMSDEGGRLTRFEYDDHGNLITLIDPAGARTTHTYDAFRQRVTTTNAVGAVTRFAYDVQGNRTAVTDPLGNTGRFAYDSVGRLVRSTDPRGRATTFVYNPVNRLTETRDAAGGTTIYAYDPNGNLLSVTPPSGGRITRSYDALDRVAVQTDPLGVSESFTYDHGGNLITHTDRAHRVRSYQYDLLGRRITATYADGAATAWAYDAVGRLTRVDDSVVGTILNRYDARDRILAQVTPQGTVSYEYDVASRRTRMDVPGSAPVTYGYDAASRLTEVSQAGRTAHLTHDPAGRHTSLTLPNGLVTEYGYDLASQLTSLLYRTPASVLGELTYHYDAAGLRIRIGGSLADTLLPPAVPTATYDAANRQLTFGDTHTTFDANGNVTSISGPGGITSLTWDARNRLITISGPSVTAEHTYDAFGRRIMKRVGGVATSYLYDGANLIQELAASGTVSYLHSDMIDELLMIERSEGRFFPTADALLSVLLLTTDAGATTARYVFEPFGTTTSSNPSFPNAFRFTGRELDETGLYYYRARYYHPGLQRFIAEDPIGLAGGDLNPYAYVRNRPTTLRDPLGLRIDWGGYVLTNPIVISNLQWLNQNIINSGFNDNQFTIRVTGGDRYIDRSGVIRSLTNNSIVEESAKNSPHLIEEGARGVDFTISGVSGDVLEKALQGTEFDLSKTYQERRRDRHGHTSLPDEPGFRNPSWPGDDSPDLGKRKGK